jgi:hypothetical protein
MNITYLFKLLNYIEIETQYIYMYQVTKIYNIRNSNFNKRRSSQTLIHMPKIFQRISVY